MANATIDRVQIEVEATARGTSAVFSQLERQLSTIKSALASVDVSKLQSISKNSKSLSINTSGMSKAERDISSSVDKIKQSLAGLNAYKNAALSGDSSSLTSFNRRVVSIQSNIDTLGEKLKQVGNNLTGSSITSDVFQAYRESLAEVQSELDTTKTKVSETVALMNSEQPTIDTSGTSSGLSDISDKAKTAFSILTKMGKTSFSTLKSGLSKIKDSLSKIGNSASKNVSTGFGKILKYGFGIRSMYVLFRRLRTAIKDSFTELQKSGAYYQTTKSNVEALKNSLTTLKYQFGAAFEPIFNTIAPALQTLINYLVAVMNTISAFVAKLTGKSTYSKAVASTAAIAKNTGSAAGSAKELNKQLQGFDERNNLDLDSGSSGGGGGGGSSDSSGVNYVEENVNSALSDFASELADLIKSGDWEAVGSAISSKITDALNGINWTTIKTKAANFGTNLASFFNGFINKDLFSSIGTTIAEAVNTAFTGLNSFGTTFEWSEFGASIGTGISSWFKTADFTLYGDTVHTWVSGLLDAGISLLENTDFEEIGKKLADFLNGLQIGDLASKLFTFAKTLVKAIAKALTSLWENADAQTKMGLAIVGLIAAAKLTGLSGTLASLIGSALSGQVIPITSPITLTILKVAGVVAAAGLGWTLGKKLSQWVAEKLSGTSGISAEAAEDYIKVSQHMTFEMFIDDVKTAASEKTSSGKNRLWEAWSNMLNDWYEPVYQEIDYQIDKYKENNKKETKTDSNGRKLDEGLKFHVGSETTRSGGKPRNDTNLKGIELKINTKYTGEVTSKNELEKETENWNKMSEAAGKSSDSIYTSKVGGQLRSIDDVAYWKKKFLDLYDNWKSKTATMKTEESGLSKSSGWLNLLEDLRKKWEAKSTTATMHTKESGLDSFTKANGLLKQVQDLATSWAKTSSTSTMSLNLSGTAKNASDLSNIAQSARTLSDNWKEGSHSSSWNLTTSGDPSSINNFAGAAKNMYDSFYSGSHTASYSISTNIEDNSLQQAIDKINNALATKIKFTAEAKKAKGGIYTGGSWHSIPQYASGTLSAGSVFVAGEAGPEIVGDINGRTEVLNRSQIAATMRASILDAMSQFRNAQMVTPQQVVYNNQANDYSTSNYASRELDAIREQNELLREQNGLLQIIANKDVTISSRDIFNATRGEANDYFNRTGNSPFIM